jgi:hypothetical protein
MFSIKELENCPSLMMGKSKVVLKSTFLLKSEQLMKITIKECCTQKIVNYLSLFEGYTQFNVAQSLI